MDKPRWQDLKRILEQATSLPESERPHLLDESCGADHALRSELESLLQHHTVSNPLDRPAVHHAAHLFLDPPPGSLGAYRIMSHIGLGGTSDVYLAQRADGHFEKQVAVKILRSGIYGDDMRRRFQRERQILADLDHPHIVRLLDAGITPDGRPYLVEEYVDGPPVTLFAESRQLTLDQRLDLFRSICEAVAYAHQRGVVHRDLKPSNILTTAEGLPKLVDFGVAGLLAAANVSAQPTISQLRYWTPAYSSPEHARGEPAGPASDVYSLGLILCELLLGGLALKHDASPAAETTLHAAQSLPRPLRPIAARCLEWNPSARYADAGALLDALRGLSGSQLHPPRWRNRRHFRRMAIAAAVTILVALSIWTWSRWSLAPPIHTPQLLAPDIVLQSRPSLSPDGRWVAYRRRNELVVRPLGGGPYRKLVDRGQHPRWSPNGNSIAFYKTLAEGIHRVFIVSPETAAVRELPGRFHSAATYGWHPDSRSLCMPHRESPGEPFRLFRVDVESGTGAPLTSPEKPMFGDIDCSFSPDVKYLAFSRFETAGAADLWVIGMGDKTARRLTRDSAGIMGLDWTPDGREVVFASRRSGSPRLWRIQAFSTLAARPFPVADGDSGAESPSFQSFALPSLQPTRLVFQRTRDDVEVVRLSLDGLNVWTVAGHPAYDDWPALSPDGLRVAFVSDRTGATELWTARHNGADQTQLTRFGNTSLTAPAWSPDGENLVFAANPEGRYAIYRLAANGGGLRRLTHDSGSEGNPSWSADGRFVYFRSNRSGQIEIWKIAADASMPAVQITQPCK